MPRDDDLLSSTGGFFKMDGRDPVQSDSQWGWIGWEGEWMIGTDCEKLAKGAWRLIVLLLVQVLFKKMIFC